MTPCPDCTKAQTNPQHRLFNPACLYCGARIIQHLGTLPISTSEIATRRRTNLADWVAHGHSEAQIRALAKGALCTGPLATGPASISACVDPPKTKRR